MAIIRQLRLAIDDIKSIYYRRSVWYNFAIEGIRDQYRMTLLGPIWMLLNYVIFVGSLILVFSEFNNDSNIISHISIGVLVWNFMSETISESLYVFKREAALIKGTPLGLTVYMMQSFLQSLIRLTMSVVPCIIFISFDDGIYYINIIYTLMGVILLAVTAPSVIAVVSILSVYAPDSQYIISNVLRIVFFLTPVFWNTDRVGSHIINIVYVNPFFHFISIVRDPLVDNNIPGDSYVIALTLALALYLLAFVLLIKAKKDLVFFL